MDTNTQGDNAPKQPFRDGAPSLLNWILFTFAVIVAVLTLLGPAIGNTFSNIVVGI